MLDDQTEVDGADIQAVLRLCDDLMREGKEVPLEYQERAIRHYLSIDPNRDDLSYRLANILMEQQRPISFGLEEKSLRHAISTSPGRIDLLNRLATVVLQNAVQQPDAEGCDLKPDTKILERARKHLELAHDSAEFSGLPGYGARWGEYSARMQRAIVSFASPTEAIRYAQLEIGFEHRLIAGQALQHYAMYRRELATEFPQFSHKIDLFEESSFSAPGTTFRIEGTLVSNITLYLARIILSCLSLVPDARIIIELGGGYGAPARAWLQNPISPISTYIIVDIPESLFFAETFLTAEFGADAVYYVNDDAALDLSTIDGARVVLCPIHRIGALEALPVDLIINTGSLQEMTEDWVSFYMAWLERQRTRYFYSQNYFGQPVGFLAESMNLWSPRPSPAWKAKLLRINAAFIRMQADRNYLEALYERDVTTLPSGDILARLNGLSERSMTIELLSEYMDLFRRAPSVDTANTILRRAMIEMPTHPKEALYLAEWLMEKSEHNDSISSWRATLRNERASGVEGTT